MSTRNLVLSALLLLLIRVALIIWGGQHDAPGGDQLAFYSASQQLAHSSTEWLKGGGEFGYRAPVHISIPGGSNTADQPPGPPAMPTMRSVTTP